MSVCLRMLVAVTAFAVLGLEEVGGARRLLLVTGVDHVAHDWRTTSPVLRDILEQDHEFAVRVVEHPELLADDMMFDYDVIVLHFRNDKPLAREERVRNNLTAFVGKGGGLVAIHFACGAFGDWPEYGDLVGKVWDGVNTHDPRGPFKVRIVDSGHPITRGMNDFQTDDELYIGLVGERPVQLLGVARSTVTGQEHPMAFAFEYGKGRVFHTPLGHDERALQAHGTANLIRRGCRWVARDPDL